MRSRGQECLHDGSIIVGSRARQVQGSAVRVVDGVHVRSSLEEEAHDADIREEDSGPSVVVHEGGRLHGIGSRDRQVQQGVTGRGARVDPID